MSRDDRLNDLLKQARGIEPRPGFEEAVWSRIRAEGTARVGAWRGWIAPLALAAGLVAGIGLGLLFPVTGNTAGRTPPVASAGSLTGAYMMLASGGDHE